jgi:hypothetical protein
MKRVHVAVSLVILAGAAGATARAGFVPAWSYVPAPLRVELARVGGGSLYLPARVPSFYRYRSGAAFAGGTLTVPFVDRVRVREGVWRWTTRTFTWRVQRLPVTTGCSAWGHSEKTQQVGGNKVYTSTSTPAGALAWRCVVDRRGRTLVLSATQTGAGAVPLAIVVASGLDVAGRTSATTVALTVSPSTVRRGGSVLVRGVAGGCTSGDTVTIISPAFSPGHSFAGVPAVFAEVGAAGRFSTTARIPARRRPGSYVLTARCGGGNLGVSARLVVA